MKARPGKKGTQKSPAPILVAHLPEAAAGGDCPCDPSVIHVRQCSFLGKCQECPEMPGCVDPCPGCAAHMALMARLNLRGMI